MNGIRQVILLKNAGIYRFTGAEYGLAYGKSLPGCNGFYSIHKGNKFSVNGLYIQEFEAVIFLEKSLRGQ